MSVSRRRVAPLQTEQKLELILPIDLMRMKTRVNFGGKKVTEPGLESRSCGWKVNILLLSQRR